MTRVMGHMIMNQSSVAARSPRRLAITLEHLHEPLSMAPRRSLTRRRTTVSMVLGRSTSERLILDEIWRRTFKLKKELSQDSQEKGSLRKR